MAYLMLKDLYFYQLKLVRLKRLFLDLSQMTLQIFQLSQGYSCRIWLNFSHFLKDGQVEGMLSVNGSTGAVWYHNWHGAFIGMTEEHD